MMQENRNRCPICARGCDLSVPGCGRGAEYARSGGRIQESARQQRGHGPESGPSARPGHPRDSRHGHGPRLVFEKIDEQMVMKYLHHAVGIADNGGIPQERAEEMFSVLTGEETAQLAGLLEKLSEHWMRMAPNRPPHHGRR